MTADQWPVVAFAWPGLPDYAARCLAELKRMHGTSLHVLATRPSVPIEGMELSIGQPVHWMAGDGETQGWRDFGLEPPNVLFAGGHSTPAFRRVLEEARTAGAAVVLLSDNNWQGSLRHWLVDPMRYRLQFRKTFDAVFVPGKSGRAYNRHMGFAPDRIFMGLYGADPAVFRPGGSLQSRPKELLFVGQFIDRKNVVTLARVFERLAQDNRGWQLRLCGSGPLHNQVPRSDNIIVEGFVQPAELAGKMRDARCLVLPSLEEHWGLVVHEAALSGCALALSDAVGAAPDLASKENSVAFAAGDAAAMEAALSKLMAWSDEQWARAQQVSLAKAAHFGPARFAQSCIDMIELLCEVRAPRLAGRAQ